MVRAPDPQDRASSARADAGRDAADSPAFDDVFRRHAGRVSRWAAMLGGRGVDPDDVVQEVFVTAHAKWADLARDGFADPAVRVWLYRATALIVKRRRRHERIRQWLSGSPDDYGRHLPAAGPSALDALVSREDAGAVWRVLDTLSERHRKVLLLFELEELSGEEVAAITGVRVSTVWVQLHRAREAFLRRARELGAAPNEEEAT